MVIFIGRNSTDGWGSQISLIDTEIPRIFGGSQISLIDTEIPQIFGGSLISRIDTEIPQIFWGLTDVF